LAQNQPSRTRSGIGRHTLGRLQFGQGGSLFTDIKNQQFHLIVSDVFAVVPGIDDFVDAVAFLQDDGLAGLGFYAERARYDIGHVYHGVLVDRQGFFRGDFYAHQRHFRMRDSLRLDGSTIPRRVGAQENFVSGGAFLKGSQRRDAEGRPYNR